MQFSTREEIEAPIGFVFEQLTNFDRHQRAALSRGVEVERIDRRTSRGAGMSWRCLFMLRGKPRRLEITLQQFEPTTVLVFDGESQNLSGALTVELTEVSPRRTRVLVKLDVRPLTLAARVVLQSLKLAKARTRARFSNRVRNQAGEIERRYRDGRA
ncbi:hypothetical protein U879_14260 [Defluviimonas sp. 20V17]|uniref:Polyketide cyclase / dehydrase and lipid transport n=1 Tax=Allgaiera indica TaxID=765699 RepID=A0AAN4UNC8_9RHOB|nr:SRPBCC family protein [Allgaiera indica]KDB03022.1 hypothetical protein U879_14260 [Defluviimonas sp. 20V17]GHD98655.1 hypothetical protein GCM10008024_03040 [Allgaiera indica]SDW09062.1 hypothetical protein SAMN05444006_101247 [Allgaiera indica]